MRRKLAQDEGVRKTFIATFSKIGKKTGYKGYSEDTLLLIDIHDAATGEKVSDHIWFTFSKAFEAIDMKAGIKISFDARVKEYSKGYVNRALGINQKKRDFKLSHPTKVKLIPG